MSPACGPRSNAFNSKPIVVRNVVPKPDGTARHRVLCGVCWRIRDLSASCKWQTEYHPVWSRLTFSSLGASRSCVKGPIFSNSPLVSDGSVIDRLVKKMIEHLQHL